MKSLRLLCIFLTVSCFVITAEAHQLPFQALEVATPVNRGAVRFETALTYDSYAGAGYDYTLMAKLTHGALNDMDVEIEMPYLFMERGKTENGFGDIRFRSKVRFVKGREASPLSLSGQMIGKVPSGARNRGLGTGGPDIGFLAIASKEVFPATIHLNLGYTFAGNSSDRLPTEKAVESSMGYVVGVEFETTSEHLRLLAEVAGQNHNPRDVNNDPSLELLGGATYEAQERLVVSGALGVGARSVAAGSPNHTVTISLAYRF